jgi:uncharacterized protein (DUF1697 family)
VRVAALLRGVNIGPHKRISMPALREIVAGLGHEDVETYLQSGNVVFTPARARGKALDDQLADAIAAATGLEVGVVVRTGRELAEVVAGSPYRVEDPTRLVVAFFGAVVGPDGLGLGEPGSYAPDELTLAGANAYVSVPGGQARSKLIELLAKRTRPTVVTLRNWRTVTALAELTR